MRNKALFLDRDGVINIDHGYVHRKEDCEFVPGIFDLVADAKAAGYLIIVVTNQAGIGRGYYSQDTFDMFMKWMSNQFPGGFDAVYSCPFHPRHGKGPFLKESIYRKPEPGMLLKAIRTFDISPNESIMVGDKESDMVAGSRANIGRLFLFADEVVQVPCTRIKSLTDLIGEL